MKFDQSIKILLALIAAGLWTLIIILWPETKINNVAKARKAEQRVPKKRSVDYDSLTVHRLNIVNEEGQLQYVIADSSHFPPIISNGKVKHTRSISPHGAVFYNNRGNEAGGIAFSHAKNHRQHAMILDYRNSDGMGFGISDNRPKNYYAGFFIRDPVPLGVNIKKRKGGSANTERLAIMDTNGNASIILRDKRGNNRIKLEVTKNGQAFIKILNASGKIMDQIPRH